MDLLDSALEPSNHLAGLEQRRWSGGAVPQHVAQIHEVARRLVKQPGVSRRLRPQAELVRKLADALPQSGRS